MKAKLSLIGKSKSLPDKFVLDKAKNEDKFNPSAVFEVDHLCNKIEYE